MTEWNTKVSDLWRYYHNTGDENIKKIAKKFGEDPRGNGKRWSSDEDSILIDLIKQNKSYSYISQILQSYDYNRSRHAVSSRASALNLPVRKYGRKFEKSDEKMSEGGQAE